MVCGTAKKEPLQISSAIQAKANELTKGLKTDDEKIQATYSFVALKYHYIGLDLGHRALPAACRRRYS